MNNVTLKMKNIQALLYLVLLTSPGFAQKIFHTRIDKTDILLRGTPVTVAQVTITAPSAGKVVVRFDGDCISSPGDRIVLAASRTQNWGGNDNSVLVKAISNDLNNNVFSHTRVYDVTAGDHTFYAVAENSAEIAGNGRASIYGSLTVEWFPEIPGQAFVRHKGIVQSNFNVEGAPVVLAEQTINVPATGKVIVRFDGLCISSDGDLIFLAASDTPNWGAYDGSSSIEIPDGEFNKNSFAHVRTYDVSPGEHTYYAVAENFYEIYGNGIASLYGSLTVSYYPEPSPVKMAHAGISQIGIVIDNGPVTLSEVVLDAPSAGKVALNFSGTCIGSFGDYIKLAANNVPNWSDHDGSIGFEPFSSDRNRTSFSHTRMFDVGPGEHHYYAVAQNVQEFFGSGLVVVYGSLNATFYPTGSVPTTEQVAFDEISIAPNPALDVVRINLASFVEMDFTWTLLDAKGVVVQTMEPGAMSVASHLELDVSGLPKGLYFIRLSNGSGNVTRTFVHL
jgi:Secretion system C-terminal sorting domain